MVCTKLAGVGVGVTSLPKNRGFYNLLLLSGGLRPFSVGIYRLIKPALSDLVNQPVAWLSKASLIPYTSHHSILVHNTFGSQDGYANGDN